jgi:ATPase subunit of ABC transporter with duplicated ATPase domains
MNNKITLFSDKIEVLINGKKLINESNIVINSKTKYFLMGNNGVGKTTLMNQLYEKIKNIDILMVEQDIIIDYENQTIEDFILHADIELYKKYTKMTELEQLEELNDEQQEEYNLLSEFVCIKNWDKYVAKSYKILNGLGFKDIKMSVNLLSGGWRMRLALGKAILYEPCILFLDESNNHLDLNAGIWLMDYLGSYPNTLIMITHQIDFINYLADCIWWVGNPECLGTKIYTIHGTYKNLLEFLKQTNKEVTQKYEKTQKKVIEMKKKACSKNEIEDFIIKASCPRPQKEYNVNIKFENINNRFGLKNIIEFRDIIFGYGDNIIFDNVDFNINLKSRYIIVGDNGVGKTTLFNLCKKQLDLLHGEIIIDSRINIAHYHQLTIDNIPLNLNSIEYLQSLNNKLSEDEARARLGKIGLKKIENFDIPKNKIGDLSGGQKARLGLCVVQLWNPEIILLDEPTNNLDVVSINALIDGINEYNGAVIIITHDTHLIESIDNYELYQISNKKINKFNGMFEDYKNFIINM